MGAVRSGNCWKVSLKDPEGDAEKAEKPKKKKQIKWEIDVDTLVRLYFCTFNVSQSENLLKPPRSF
jgi:hypothetical protein